MSKKKTIKEVQQDLNEIYGKDEWTILTYNGGDNPCTLVHKCGESKTITIAKNARRGLLSCSCSPSIKRLKMISDNNKAKQETLQQKIDEIYGEGVWTIVEFNGLEKPLRVRHCCHGEIEKTISRARNIRKGTCICECELKKNR